MNSIAEASPSVVALQTPINAAQTPNLQLPYLELTDRLIWWTGLVIIVVAAGAWLIRSRSNPLGKAPPRPNRLMPEHVLILMGGFFCLVWFFRWLLGRLPGDVGLTVIAGNAAQLMGGIGCLALAAAVFDGGARRFSLGRGRILLRLAEGLVLFFVAITACGVTYQATEALVRLAGTDPDGLPKHSVIEALATGAVPPWTLWLGAVVIAPIAEECFFRGVLQTLLRNLTARPWLAVLATALAFGVAHAQQPQVIPTIAALGVLLGVSYERSGSLVTPVLLHALFNFKTMVWQALGAGG